MVLWLRWSVRHSKATACALVFGRSCARLRARRMLVELIRGARATASQRAQFRLGGEGIELVLRDLQPTLPPI